MDTIEILEKIKKEVTEWIDNLEVTAKHWEKEGDNLQVEYCLGMICGLEDLNSHILNREIRKARKNAKK